MVAVKCKKGGIPPPVRGLYTYQTDTRILKPPTPMAVCRLRRWAYEEDEVGEMGRARLARRYEAAGGGAAGCWRAALALLWLALMWPW